MQRGFSLVEILISLVVLGVMVALAAPGFGEWLQNRQIRATAEMTLNGLQLARAEAVRANAPERFQFVTDLTSACALTSGNDPTGKCDTFANGNPLDPVNPQIVHKGTGEQGTPNAEITSVFLNAPPAPPGAPSAANVVTFGPLGNVIANADGSFSIVKVDVSNPWIGVGARRPLRIVVNPGGATRLCDPLAPSTEPRGCPAWP
jgi:type IV fimbrial biogenesis protein FimT